MKRLIEDNEDGITALLGQQVTLFGMNYIYTGKLAGVNATHVVLEDPAKIVYETGPFNDPSWKDAEALPPPVIVMLGAVEAIMVLDKS